MNPQQKMVPFKPLVEETSYYSLSDGSVLMVRPAVVKIFQVFGPDGKPITDMTHNNIYSVAAQNIIAVLTRDEYIQIKKRDNK
jgi:hypothetical protein